MVKKLLLFCKKKLFNFGIISIFLMIFSFFVYLLFLYPKELITNLIALFVVILSSIGLSYKNNSVWYETIKKPLTMGLISLSCAAVLSSEITKFFFFKKVLTEDYQFQICLSKYQNIGPFQGEIWLLNSGCGRYGITPYSIRMSFLDSHIHHMVKEMTKKDLAHFQKPSALALNCTEFLILEEFSRRLVSHWANKVIGIEVYGSRGGFKSYSQKKSTSTKNGILSSSEITKKFKKNPLIRNMIYEINIPPKTSIKVNRGSSNSISGLHSEWILKNDFVKISIKLTPKAIISVTGPKWLILDDAEVGKIAIVIGSFKAEFNNKRMEDREMPLYEAWVKKLKVSMDRFDWETIQDKLDKEAIRRTAIAVVK